MGHVIYSANKQNTGAIADWSFNSKDGSVWLRLIKQTGTQTTQTGGTNGVYKGGKTANVKFSVEEAGGLAQALLNRGIFKAFHQGTNTKTTVNASYYHFEAKDGKPVRSGYGLTVKQSAQDGETEWKVGLTEGAAFTLAKWLEFAMDHIFTAIYSKDKAEAEARAKSKQNGGPENGQNRRPAAPENAPQAQPESNSEFDGSFGDDGPF